MKQRKDCNNNKYCDTCYNAGYVNGIDYAFAEVQIWLSKVALKHFDSEELRKILLKKLASLSSSEGKTK
jgi:hypothetical protein